MPRRTKRVKSNPKIDEKAMLFEVAWEVCNQVGGIYTVLTSKIPSVLKHWDCDKYTMLGPYFEKQVGALFEPLEEYNTPIGQAVLEMRHKGFDVYYGTWLVTGRPRVVLFNTQSISHAIDIIKYEFWEQFHISLPGGDGLIDQVVAFGHMVSQFFRVLSQQENMVENKMVAHFHEWMAGTPIPAIRKEKLPVKIVFTTHATILGRYLAMNDDQFYEHLPYYDWIKEANHFNLSTQVNIERAAAHGAHVFTTISDPTAQECKYLLGREPDLILPNGLNIERFEAVHEFQNLHQQYKEKIHEFVMGHFFPSYSFDLNKTMYFFTSGRFEYHNKGFDLTLEALARLNHKLKESGSEVNVVMFFITKQPYTSIISDVLNSRFLMEEIRRTVDEMIQQLSKRMFFSITTEPDYTLPNLNGLVDEYLRLRLRRTKQTWKSDKLPLVVTHNMENDANDPILNFLRASNLLNKPEDRVKVIYHPDFISLTNPLFRLDYTQFIRGCHLGVFPSYYEPWGYTPLECLASGVPSITSDLSGFGDYVMKNILHFEESGIYVTNRIDQSYYESAEQLSEQMYYFTKASLRERIGIRNQAEALSTYFDWGQLIKYYQEAYLMALNR